MGEGRRPTIWIDGDACPKAVRDIVFRASARLDLPVRIVTNQAFPAPRSSRIQVIRVEAGPDVADRHIVEAVEAGDVVVTADIPLASEAVRKGATAIDIRGTLYSEETIGARAGLRDFFHELRETGLILGGPKAFGPKDKNRFANTLDKILTRACRGD